MLQLGPFPFRAVLVAAAALLAWGVLRGRLAAAPAEERSTAGSLLFDALFLGLLAARLGYVLLWWPEYLAAPRSILAIGDGGFLPWAGIAAACALVLRRTRGLRPRRRAVFGAMLAGTLAWAAGLGALALLQQSAPRLPELALADLAGEAQPLAGFAGRPVVVNLWATWCPPCRREMPALAQAEAEYPEVAFLLVNQGEETEAIRAWLAQAGLDFHHVLRDPQADLAQALGSRALPSSFFFAADGRLLDSHLGELSRARLHDLIGRHFGAKAQEIPKEDDK